ncbi:MAG: cupin domain-containing protein [Gemmatimonadota bacterium]|nr:cupin domain-containing protein [Gemmatimonadota bacterium]
MSEPSDSQSPYKTTLAQKFYAIDDHWNPRIVGELNGQHVKIAKIQGEFDWHHHENEDELFLVHRGIFRMEFRDHTVLLAPGDMLIVPRGVEHRPVADEEAEIVMFEPAGTLNTGNVVSDRTVADPKRL